MTRLRQKGGALLEYATITGAMAVVVVAAVFGMGVETKESLGATASGMEEVAAVVRDSRLPSITPVQGAGPADPVVVVPPVPEPEEEEATFRFACFDEGMVSGGTLTLRSNNHFGPGFCLYGDSGVWLANGNEFAYGSLIATPGYELLETPPAGWNSNTGLMEAFQVIKLDINVERTLLEALNEVVSGASTLPYITNPVPVERNGKKFSMADVQPGRITTRLCKTGESIAIPRGSLFQNLVFVTNCSIRFGQDVRIENAVVASTSTDAQAIHASHPLRVGRADACAEGGGAQVLTLGGARFAAGLEINGGQVVAVGPIDLAAQANGQGALLLSGVSVSGTSNIHMEFCGSGMDDNLVATWWAEVLEWLQTGA